MYALLKFGGKLIVIDIFSGAATTAVAAATALANHYCVMNEMKFVCACVGT